MIHCSPAWGELGRGAVSDHKAYPVAFYAGGLAALALLLGSCARTDLRTTPSQPEPAATRVLRPTIAAASPSRDQLPILEADESAAALQLESNQGQLVRTSYTSRLDGDQVPLLIYLPPGSSSSDGPIPAIYMLHGLSFDESQWVELGIIDYTERSIRGGHWPSLALVMPYQPEPLYSSSDGGPGSYEAELTESLIPDVEGRYPLGAPRALVGISRGGVWALEIAFRHPDEFLGVAALSPSLNLNFARPRYDPLTLAAQGDQLPARIYLGAGDKEPAVRQSTEELAAVLDEAGIPHELVIGSGGHDNIYWTESVRSALDYLVEGLSTPPSDE